MNAGYCYGCMEPLQPGQVICPYCGWNHTYRHNDDLFLTEGTILNGKYLIGRVLGKGGFGITYLGMDLTLRVKVAIKEYFPNSISSRSAGNSIVRVSSGREGWEGYQKGLMAFQAEAQTLAKFNSPSIVHVREFFQSNNTAYIVMDYIDGADLGEMIKRCGGRMAWQRVVNLFMPLMLELDKLHRKNLIHRDIKPENIKIINDENTGEERLILLDFGAARGYTMETVTYSQILTPGYAPYEQYQEKGHQGPYTDVYALCGTMYKAITGQKPPSAPDRMGSNNEKLPPFKSFGLNVPNAVEKSIANGLKKESQNRPQTMVALHDEFEKQLSKIPDKEWNSPQIITVNSISEGENKTKDTIDVFVTNNKKTSKAAKKVLLLTMSLLLVTMTLIVLIPNLINESNIPGSQNNIEIKERETEITGIIDIAEEDLLEETIQAKLSETPTPTNTPKPTITPTIVPVAIGDIISFGNYEQDNDLNNGTEAIEWRVLAVEDGKALVLSRYALDSKRYHKKYEEITWESCSLRQWLNGEFYENAFSDIEKAKIQMVLINNPDNMLTNGGNSTNDRIFLLSKEEVNKYLSTQDSRRCQATAYAKARGVNVVEKEKFVQLIGYSRWWLRSPGLHPYYASFVYVEGNIDSYTVSRDDIGVRPAFWINIL